MNKLILNKRGTNVQSINSLQLEHISIIVDPGPEPTIIGVPLVDCNGVILVDCTGIPLVCNA